MGIFGSIFGAIKDWIVGAISTIFEALLKPILDPVNFLSDALRKIFKFVLFIIDFGLNLFKMVGDLLDFGLVFIDIFVTLATNITTYIFNPFKLLILLIQLGVLFITFAISFVYHSLNITEDMKLVELLIYFILTPVMGLITSFQFAWWASWGLFIEYILLHIIDVGLKGYVSSFMYRNFIACENPPDTWYTTGSYHQGNKNSKIIFAYNKCPDGYSTSNMVGLFCKKNDDYQLTMCPHANLYRADKGLKTVGKLRNDTFNYTSSEFLKLNLYGQQKKLEEYKNNITTNNSQCTQTNSSKDELLRAICMRSNPNDESANTKSQLCYDIFCSNDRRDPLCHALTYDKIVGKNMLNSNLQILIYTVILIIFMVLVAAKQVK